MPPTIHSAKGQELDVVFVLNVTEGCIPSDMAAGSREQIEEERRLLYVAMTRARQHLHLHNRGGHHLALQPEAQIRVNWAARMKDVEVRRETRLLQFGIRKTSQGLAKII